MSFFDFYRTDWHFVTSLGADYLISQGVLVLGGAGGYIYLKNRRTQKQIALHCHEFEVGVSVSPRWFRLPDIDFELAAGVPRLAGGSISFEQLPSTGVGSILARDHHPLDSQDLAGWFVVGSLQGAAVGAGQLSAIYFNVPTLAMAASTTVVGFPVAMCAAKALGLILSTSVGVQLGGTGLLGWGSFNLEG
jgi:hypothetical protein